MGDETIGRAKDGEGGEDDEDDINGFPDDDEKEEDPMVVELRATFNDFAVVVTNPNQHGLTGGGGISNLLSISTSPRSKVAAMSNVPTGVANNSFMPVEVVQDALIRICNCYVHDDILEKAFQWCGIFDAKSGDDLSFSEFKAVFTW